MESSFDRLRAWIEGSMGPDERARFEGELARDPELMRAAEEMRLVWSATAPGLGAVPASRTTIEAILSGEEEATQRSPWQRTPWKRAAAAVILLAAAASAGVYVVRHLAAPKVPLVMLQAIPMDAPVAQALPEIPPVLASWSPVQDGKITWLHSMDEARRVSALLERPVFVYGYIDGCPICAGFQANEFRDPEIQALVARSVPVAIDLMSLDESERNELWNRRYPLLELQDDRGDIVRTFGGTMAEVDMQSELANALKDLTAPKWALVRELAAAWERARADEESGKLADASDALEKLVHQSDLPVFAAQGSRALAELGTYAWRALDHARARAATDPAGARAELDVAMRRFAGTPFEADLRAVAGAWRAGGPFPVLAHRLP